MPNTPDEILSKAAAIFKERNAVYKSNYKEVGDVLLGFFPKGITLNSRIDFMRFHIFVLLVVKMTRYTNNWATGHGDSLEDLAVYAAILAAMDEESLPEEELEPLTAKLAMDTDAFREVIDKVIASVQEEVNKTKMKQFDFLRRIEEATRKPLESFADVMDAAAKAESRAALNPELSPANREYWADAAAKPTRILHHYCTHSNHTTAGTAFCCMDEGHPGAHCCCLGIPRESEWVEGEALPSK